MVFYINFTKKVLKNALIGLFKKNESTIKMTGLRQPLVFNLIGPSRIAIDNASIDIKVLSETYTTKPKVVVVDTIGKLFSEISSMKHPIIINKCYKFNERSSYGCITHLNRLIRCTSSYHPLCFYADPESTNRHDKASQILSYNPQISQIFPLKAKSHEKMIELSIYFKL